MLLTLSHLGEEFHESQVTKWELPNLCRESVGEQGNKGTYEFIKFFMPFFLDIQMMERDTNLRKAFMLNIYL